MAINCLNNYNSNNNNCNSNRIIILNNIQINFIINSSNNIIKIKMKDYNPLILKCTIN